jgi:large subunit ribosomal protein L6e
MSAEKKPESAPVATEKKKEEEVRISAAKFLQSRKKKRCCCSAKRKRCASSKKKPTIQKLRPSLVPGVVLIILAGRFRGKRVVFLKQLEKSGLLLVTGPFRVNGVPLRRIAPAFVLATSTHVDLSGVEIPAIDESMFRKPRTPKSKKGEEDFFAHKSKEDKDRKEKAAEKKQHTIKPERKDLQKKIDTQILERIAKVELLKGYLSSTFSLRGGQFPHAMKF